jgi:hypothetical protein
MGSLLDDATYSAHPVGLEGVERLSLWVGNARLTDVSLLISLTSTAAWTFL